MADKQVYVPIIYGNFDDESFSDAVGVFLTEQQAWQALCDKLCDERYLFPYDDEENERFGEIRVNCKDRKTFEKLCETESDSWYDQKWFWKMQSFPRMPLHFDLV